MNATSSLDEWGEELKEHCAARLAACVSATSLIKHREGFGQTIRPRRGSVVASTSTALLSGEPDYFFHWIRDSSLVIDAGRILCSEDKYRAVWARLFDDFVRFSLDLSKIDGRNFIQRTDFRSETASSMISFLRAEDEIAAIHDNDVLGEARYNADGTLDFIRWSRPQYDGPALRALALMRFLDEGGGDDRDARDRTGALVSQDLRFTAQKAGEICFDIWEEEPARHYYTALVQMSALDRGTIWAKSCGQDRLAGACLSKAKELRGILEQFWSPAGGYYCSRLSDLRENHPKALDFAVILGVLHAGFEEGPHSVSSGRIQATFNRLESLFANEYAINRGCGTGIAFGRYKDDRYCSGGAYYFSSFGAAEFCYRLAKHTATPWLAKGDAILSHVRRFVPASGDLSEQYGQTIGEQTSARNLSWSYAAFLTAWHARRLALAALQNQA